VVCAGAWAAPVKAKLVGVKGDVTARATADAAWAKVAEGAMLPEGASLKTGADGEVSLVWPDGTAAKLYPLSILKVEASSRAGGASKTELNMEKGRVMSKVAKLQTSDSVFTVKTPVATAGVRGTTFDTAIDPASNQATVAVVEGSVYVAAGDVEVVVAEGFSSMVTAGEPPAPPTAIPPAQLQELKDAGNELKETAETAAAPEAAPTAPATSAAIIESVINTVKDNVVEQTTIQNVINDAVQQGCPAGGGCVQGTIEF
jgi:hypothetical protein